MPKKMQASSALDNELSSQLVASESSTYAESNQISSDTESKSELESSIPSSGILSSPSINTTEPSSKMPESEPTSSPVPSVTSTHVHQYTAKTIAPTCTEKGYTIFTCSCGTSYRDNLIAALGHNFGKWTETKAATTASTGEETRICSRCGIKETRTIDRIAEPSATSADTKKVADRILYYINQYRSSEGKSIGNALPNMTAFAEYRSQQLITNYSHDNANSIAAATALKYGKYTKEEETTWDATSKKVIHTGKIVEYYTPICGEAIGKLTMFSCGRVDEIAESLANGMYNSPDHWAYVGNTINKYISVGVSVDNGTWYCTICVSDTDIYG